MRSMMMNILPVMAVIALLGAGVRADGTYGAGVNVQAATKVSDLYASPDTFVGKTIRVDGVVTSVCTEMGCWVAVKDKVTDQSVRFQAEHDGKIVFPITLKGKSGSFQGEFVRIAANDMEGHEAAAEHAQSEPKSADFGSRYQIKVTGAVVQ